MTIKTADLIDNHADQLTLVHLPFRRFGTKPSLAGPVQTVKCFEDNVKLRAQLESPGEGRVLVVDGGSSTRIAIVGDMIAQLAIDNGWAGVILNAAIRDSAEIDAMPICLFALGTSPVKSAKNGFGAVGEAVSFGGVRFKPGGIVYGDADGVLYASSAVG